VKKKEKMVGENEGEKEKEAEEEEAEERGERVNEEEAKGNQLKRKKQENKKILKRELL